MTEPRVVPGTQVLRHDFTSAEKIELGQELSQALRQQGAINDELETTKAQYKSRLAEVSAQIAATASKIMAGYEMKPTIIRKTYDYVKGTVTLMREDTGEIFETRDMLDSERQVGLIPEAVEPVAPPATPDAAQPHRYQKSTTKLGRGWCECGKKKSDDIHNVG